MQTTQIQLLSSRFCGRALRTSSKLGHFINVWVCRLCHPSSVGCVCVSVIRINCWSRSWCPDKVMSTAKKGWLWFYAAMKSPALSLSHWLNRFPFSPSNLSMEFSINHIEVIICDALGIYLPGSNAWKAAPIWHVIIWMLSHRTVAIMIMIIIEMRMHCTNHNIQRHCPTEMAP